MCVSPFVWRAVRKPPLRAGETVVNAANKNKNQTPTMTDKTVRLGPDAVSLADDGGGPESALTAATCLPAQIAEQSLLGCTHTNEHHFGAIGHFDFFQCHVVVLLQAYFKFSFHFFFMHSRMVTTFVHQFLMFRQNIKGFFENFTKSTNSGRLRNLVKKNIKLAVCRRFLTKLT